MPVYMLSKDEVSFPYPQNAREDGLLAVGGDLSLERLILAYSYGIFPWYNPADDILWWCPRERFVIPPSEVHISRSMKKFFKKHECYIMLNRDFRHTMRQCRLQREFEEGTWITDDIEEAYYRMYEDERAVSVEAFVDGELAGGLYGVIMNRVFIGESMFSRMENGSKVALILLAAVLAENGFAIIDCQLHTDHLESMGGRYISYEEYLEYLGTVLE